MSNLTIGQKVKTNQLYFNRYGQDIQGEIISVQNEKVWVRNQFRTITIIDTLCLEAA